MNPTLLVKAAIGLVGAQCVVTLVLLGLVLEAEQPAGQGGAAGPARVDMPGGSGPPSGGPGGPGAAPGGSMGAPGGSMGGPGGSMGGPGGSMGGPGGMGSRMGTFTTEAEAVQGFGEQTVRLCDLGAILASGKTLEQISAIVEGVEACESFDCDPLIELVTIASSDGKPLPAAPPWKDAARERLQVFDQVSRIGADLHRALASADKVDARPSSAVVAATLRCATTDCDEYRAWEAAVQASADAAGIELQAAGAGPGMGAP